MEIRLLRYFLATAREENITRAAENLHITQPSLSKQLMELENNLGKKLFIRGKRKLTLTEEGLILRKRAEEILELVEKTEREISTETQEISGEISIGGMITDSVLDTATKISRINSRIKFNFYSADAVDVIERLEHGSIDFAILIYPVDTVKFDSFLLPDRSQWGLLIKQDHKLAHNSFITNEDLRNCPLIMHRRVGIQQEIAAKIQINLNELNVVATYNVLQRGPEFFAKSGLGCVITTRDTIASENDDETCFIPILPEITNQYCLVWKRSTSFSKVAKLFIDELKQSLIK